MYSPRVRQKLRWAVAVLTAVLIAGTGIANRAGALDWLENRTSDWRARVAANPARADRRIVIVDIDNASFRALTDKLGRWPWTRRVWTELTRYLTKGEPRLILFDALFSGAEPAADPEFAQVIREAGNVVLPFAFVSGKVETADAIFDPPAAARLDRIGWRAGPAFSKREWSLNAPNPVLAAAMAGAGASLWTPDPDGMSRRVPLSIRYEGRDWQTLWLAAARALEPARDFHLPTDREGRFVVRWHADPQQAYARVPLWEMICSIYPDQCDASVRRHPASEFRGRIVVIGASAAGSYEVRPTPLSETAPGFYIVVNALDNLLHGDAIRRSPSWTAWALISLLALVPAWAVLRYRSVAPPLFAAAAAFILYAAVCFWAYGQTLWLPMSAPLLAAAASFSGNLTLRYFMADRELSRTRGTLERYVSPQLVRHVMDNLDSIRFDGEKRKLTVFFSDVRGFTTLTEKSDPVQLLKQLNEYLEAMTDIVFRHDGIVDKFIGDGLMAHWGAFTPERPNALLAARASLEMLDALRGLNEKWRRQGMPELDIGIGLNTAEVIFGNVGTGKKSDFTVIGDGVNLAARLEGANKEYRTNIIISEATRRELGDGAEVRPLGEIVVKGKTVGVEIYELKGLGPGASSGYGQRVGATE